MKAVKRVFASVLVMAVMMSMLILPASAAGANWSDDWDDYFQNFKLTYAGNYTTGYASAVQSILYGCTVTKPYIERAGKVDGLFGTGTKDAVIAFQKDRGLKPADGMVGKDTWRAMANYMDEDTFRVLSADDREAISIKYESSLYKFCYYPTVGKAVTDKPFHEAYR